MELFFFENWNQICYYRCYLAACSQYFYSMFTKDFVEKMQAQVELKGVSASGLRALLDYAYTGSIVINNANLHVGRF